MVEHSPKDIAREGKKATTTVLAMIFFLSLQRVRSRTESTHRYVKERGIHLPKGLCINYPG